ncbi:MAG: M1 family metallopeptidase [Saprospiraceae bacterium]|nr:M1 family metallopeptidase [Saprospiraceae bacterium]
MRNPNTFCLYLLLFVIFLMTNECIHAQNNAYFQQNVDYTISATLNDSSHVITGDWQMVYTNNSPDTLSFIYMHLWPNAFRNKNSPYANQNLRVGNLDFYFAADSTLGYIKGLQFKSEDKELTFDKVENGTEIIKLQLPRPLPPNSKITINTPYKLKLPKCFSRIGHEGQSYQVSQWYPKPAVYDRQGWHPIPYLDMGEFYSEYGSFDVTITIPSNYVVAATGTLQTQSEIDFLNEKYENQSNDVGTDNFPPSSNNMKTIHFTASQVHDFAWFADKRFRIGKKDCLLPSNKIVKCWSFYLPSEQNIWKDAVTYVERAVQFYSKTVGEYPYAQATALRGSLIAGGGMEYPMITVIAKTDDPASLDKVITHEVGHNWFYGILGSNERDYAWMDEGINSYYDHRYTSSLYPSEGNRIPKFLSGLRQYDLANLAYLWQARRGFDQATEINADKFSSINYFVSIYEKPAHMLKLLENYLGTDVYDKAMQSYFQQWKFKHPQPNDLKKHLETFTNKDLSWLFDDIFKDNKKIDYKILKVEKSEDFNITIKNKTGVKSPVQLTAFDKNNKELFTQWYSGFDSTRTVSFKAGEYDRISIDPTMLSWDFYPQNNNYYLNKKLKRVEPFEFHFLPDVENPVKTSIFCTPVVGWNNYDKTMLGLWLTNSILPERKFEYSLTPMFGFGSKSLDGFASIAYNKLFSKGKISKVSLKLNAQKFSYDYNWNDDLHMNYYKLAPELRFDLRPSTANNIVQSISIRHINITQKNIEYDTTTKHNYFQNDNYYVNEVKYTLIDRQKLAPLTWEITFQNGKTFNKIFTSLQKSYRYDVKGRSIGARVFGGFQSRNVKDGVYDADSRFYLSGTTGFVRYQRDYLHDHLLLDRSAQDPVFSRQIFEKDAYLKTLSNLSSDSWMAGGSFTANLPYPFPKFLKAFFDLAIFPDYDKKTQVAYVTGLTVSVLKSKAFEIHIPLWENTILSDNLYLSSPTNPKIKSDYLARVLSRVTFTFDMNSLNPKSIINSVVSF